MFIATGQDAANVAESSAAFVYAERHDRGRDRGCGELSLGSAVVAEEWVDAHDLYGRNR